VYISKWSCLIVRHLLLGLYNMIVLTDWPADWHR